MYRKYIYISDKMLERVFCPIVALLSVLSACHVAFAVSGLQCFVYCWCIECVALMMRWFGVCNRFVGALRRVARNLSVCCVRFKWPHKWQSYFSDSTSFSCHVCRTNAILFYSLTCCLREVVAIDNVHRGWEKCQCYKGSLCLPLCTTKMISVIF